MFQVSFSYRLLPVGKLFTFSSFPEQLVQFQPKLCTNHPWVMGIHVCSNEARPSPRGDYNAIVNITLTKFLEKL